ncbi:MAG: S9 family peptidase [Bacteroidetes bacterium]|nr:MAG: S9 family peptidase [Bacteroidota bacterium]
MIRLLWLFVVTLLPASLLAQTSPKRALTHDIYDHWQRIRNERLSADGRWLSYQIAPQRGDGWLYVQDLNSGRVDSFARGQDARFLPRNQYLVFRISAPYDHIRAAKKAGKKGDDLPPDTLGIWDPHTGRLRTFANLESFQLPPKGGDWIAFQYQPVADSTDSTAAEPPEGTHPLMLLQPETGDSLILEAVSAYAWADSGTALLALQTLGDSIDSVRVQRLQVDGAYVETLFEGPGAAQHPVLDAAGRQAAFLHSPDTGDIKIFDLYYQTAEAMARVVVDSSDRRLPPGWAVSSERAPSFSRSGHRLFFGTAPIPEEAPKDSLLDEEKVRLDLWHWQDDRLQPEQLEDLKADQTRTYLAVWDVAQGEMSQLGTETIHRVDLLDEGESDWALGTDSRRYDRFMSWEYPHYRDLYLIDLQSGEATLALERVQYETRVSPDGEFIVWYDAQAQVWMSYAAATGSSVPLTAGLKVAFYDEEEDIPAEPGSYGIAGWTRGANRVVLYDRYDLWACDPTGRQKPQKLSQGWGRKNRIRLRFQDLDREDPWLPGHLLLQGQSEETRAEAFYHLALTGKQPPQQLMGSDHHYSGLKRAKTGNRLLWRRESISDYPDLWTSDTLFRAPAQCTAANQQQQEYRWATVEPVRWEAFDGSQIEGLLYKPDDFDPDRKYPMLVYFYERKSDTRHDYYSPLPSRSIIYPSYYCSNEYLVFIPDIHYTTGQPGEDAYNCIVSGVEHLIRERAYIDSSRLGLQGQSWGGYQVAYLVTRTGKRFAAAMAGAPVSNMTSAYGGIRWGSGLSRMFQYEETQSRLGTTLWEDPERYIRNSPLFRAPEVQTPLLMMHNDADGAVPWYQGIEFFAALRRLDKPTWLLVYNDEAHNLTRWPNRVDLSIRMQQFFDHYLKDAPAPRWLREGIPAIEKGRTLGYE